MIKSKKIHNFYDQPQELHYQILKYISLSDIQPLVYSSFESYSIVTKNYMFWHSKYKKQIKKDLLVTSAKIFKDELKKKYMNHYYMIGGIEETRAEIHTNQVDITQIARSKNKVFVSSDDQTIKMFEMCNEQYNNVFYDGHLRKKN